MKKMFVLLLFLVTLTGCGGPSKELINFAQQEKVWLEQLDSIVQQINNDYSLWLSGEINRGQLATNLSQYTPIVKDAREQRSKLYKALSKNDKDNELYSKGLYYGYSINLNVYGFLLDATQGYFGGNMNHKAIADDDLQERYNASMQAGYSRKHKLLQDSIQELFVE